jgi:hypothetical protein
MVRMYVCMERIRIGTRMVGDVISITFVMRCGAVWCGVENCVTEGEEGANGETRAKLRRA